MNTDYLPIVDFLNEQSEYTNPILIGAREIVAFISGQELETGGILKSFSIAKGRLEFKISVSGKIKILYWK